MSKVKWFVSQKTLKMFYNCFVQPHIIYGITLWGGTFDKGLTRLKKLQKKAIRLLTGARRSDHSEPRFKGLGILKLEDLYKLHTNCLTFDCMNETAPIRMQNLFSYRAEEQGTSTRSQADKPFDIKLNRSSAKTGPVLKSSFAYKAPEAWNSLPDSIQTSTRKQELCSKLKSLYLEQYQNRLPCSNILCSDVDFCYHINGN